jgi:Tol biopolymer transport system component
LQALSQHLEAGERETLLEERPVAVPSNPPPALADSLAKRLATSLTRPAQVSPLFLLVGLAVIGLTFWLFWPRAGTAPFKQELRFETLFGKRGLGLASLKKSRFSPNGKMIAFAATGEGNNMWVKQVSGGPERQATFGPWREDSPVWSPDGEQLAFVSTRGQQLGIWTIPYLGGTPALRKTLASGEAVNTVVWPSLTAWAQDGAALYYEWNYQLFRLDLNSQEVTLVLGPNQLFQTPQDFALSPHQQEAAFTAQQNGQSDLWRIKLPDGAPQRLTNDPALEQPPLWRSDSQLLYNVLREGKRQVYLLDLAGGAPVLIPTGDHQCYLADYAAATGCVLCQEQRDESDIFTVSSAGGVEQQITNDLGAEFWASVAPDGAALLYQVLPGERFVWEPRKSLLFSKPLSTKGPPVQLAADASEAQWSPDGQHIAFLRLADPRIAQLWTVNAAGGAVRRLSTDSIVSNGVRNSPPYNRLQLKEWCWSPDSRHLAYCATQAGAANVFITTADGAQTTAVTANRDPGLRFDCPVWSPDGQRLAFVSGPSLRAVPGQQKRSLWVKQQEQLTEVFQTEDLLRFLGWLANDQLALALADSSAGSHSQPTTVRLLSLSLKGGAQRELALLTETYLSNAHLSPSGRNVAFVRAQNGRDDIWLLALAAGPPRRLTNNSDPSFVFASLAWAPDGKTIYYDKQARWNLLTLIDRLD